jgi:hypothetical protein
MAMTMGSAFVPDHEFQNDVGCLMLLCRRRVSGARDQLTLQACASVHAQVLA